MISSIKNSLYHAYERAPSQENIVAVGGLFMDGASVIYTKLTESKVPVKTERDILIGISQLEKTIESKEDPIALLRSMPELLHGKSMDGKALTFDRIEELDQDDAIILCKELLSTKRRELSGDFGDEVGSDFVMVNESDGGPPPGYGDIALETIQRAGVSAASSVVSATGVVVSSAASSATSLGFAAFDLIPENPLVDKTPKPVAIELGDLSRPIVEEKKRDGGDLPGIDLDNDLPPPDIDSDDDLGDDLGDDLL